ncbi:cation diffusion facilitator family transporter [Legionella spiritensis]|uniref:cation diffusion facilitator family transporter n=1 Tax=Legionella spiritensis TaxID=452 RepID=UPI000F6C92F5|nr:cation diffusion facilitator family transporter [Legionella spiritensis]VEG92278.1 cation efflux family protein [Legionella spiritensis]
MVVADRYWQAKKVTLIGALVNTLLGITKLVGGLLLHSHALVADGVHSFSDLVTDVMVLFASKFGSQDADVSHPYGHKRIETAATLLLALLLILAGIGIAWDAFRELIQGSSETPGWLALPIALLSLVANEILFYYTRHVGQTIQSALILANAWHHRSDAASSAVVAIGLLGSLFGYVYLDAVAAVIVGILIVKMGVDYGWNSVKELVDTAVEPAMLEKIESIIRDIDGVKKIHQLRSRLMGGDILIDVHVLVDPFISVSEGHYIAQHVHHSLVKKLDRVKDVTVHIDPEDDEITCPSMHLPNRNQLNSQFVQAWKHAFPGIMSWTVHYLDGRMIMDIVYEGEPNDKKQWREMIEKTLVLHPYIQEVRILSHYGRITTEQGS